MSPWSFQEFILSMHLSHLASHCARRTSAGPTGSAAACSVAARPIRARVVNATARIGEFSFECLVIVVLLRAHSAFCKGDTAVQRRFLLTPRPPQCAGKGLGVPRSAPLESR